MKKYPKINGGALAIRLLILALATSAGAETVTVSRVWPEKIVYKPGETAKITVDLENKTKDALTASVSLAINYGLADRDELPAQPANLSAGGKATLTFAYPVPKGRKWGHEALAIVKDASGMAKGREFFTVGDNPWEVGHYLTLFQIRDTKKNKQIDDALMPKYRGSYITTLEAYAWQPSFFDCMAPATDTWVSCQGYKEGKEDWQYLVQRAHEIGMAVVTYIQSSSSGPVGCDFIRRHPELLTYDKNGAPPVYALDVDELEAFRNEPEKTKYGQMCGLYSFPGNFLSVNATNGDFWIDQVIKSTEMFGWDGFRSDGAPAIVEGYDYTGVLHKVPDLGEANAVFLKKVRQKLTERFPHFLFGWNNVAGGYPQMSNSQAEEDVMLPDAYSLFENFNSAVEPSSPFHPWKKAAYYLQNEAAPVREHGGFPHAGWMGSNRYLEAVASASGVQMDAWGGPQYLNYRRFEFRWSEFLWDNHLRYVRPGDQAVKVEAPSQVWWQDFVQSRDLPDGRKRVIVHLLNMPANDDEGWADRPPARVANVRVKFTIPAGKKLNRIVAFSPDEAEDVIETKPAADGSLVLPELKLWTVVVAEFK